MSVCWTHQHCLCLGCSRSSKLSLKHDELQWSEYYNNFLGYKTVKPKQGSFYLIRKQVLFLICVKSDLKISCNFRNEEFAFVPFYVKQSSCDRVFNTNIQYYGIRIGYPWIFNITCSQRSYLTLQVRNSWSDRANKVLHVIFRFLIIFIFFLCLSAPQLLTKWQKQQLTLVPEKGALMGEGGWDGWIDRKISDFWWKLEKK